MATTTIKSTYSLDVETVRTLEVGVLDDGVDIERRVRDVRAEHRGVGRVPVRLATADEADFRRFEAFGLQLA